MKYNPTLEQNLAQLGNVLGNLIGRMFPYTALDTYWHGRAVEMKITEVSIRHTRDGKPSGVNVRNDLRFEDGYVGDFTMDGVSFYREYYETI